MRTLIEKEIRLLLPAFVAALVLAILPIWVLSASRYLDGKEGIRAAYAFLFGIAVLGLSSFGREIGMRTLPFALAQPLERGRIWWTKVSVMALCVALAFDAWWLSESLCISRHHGAGMVSGYVLANFALLTAVLVAGGLWMTLLLRQVAAALWLTLLIPVATTIVMEAMGGPEWLTSAVWGVYAVTGFFLAKRQFFQMQDTAWTGGVVSLGHAKDDTEGNGLREQRPWAALLRKELQLHQFTLAGIAALLVLHLGAVLVRKFGAHVLGHDTLSALEMFGGVWLLVPLLAGCQSVAEERQLGTLDGLLTLSVSRKAQFCVKLIFVIVLGGLLSAALLCGVEAVAHGMGAGANTVAMGIDLQGWGIIPIFLAFTVLSFVAFYASTLTRSVVQALAAGMAAAFVFWFVRMLATHSVEAIDAFGYRLWPAMAYPALMVTLLWLGYGNFRWVFESGRRWRRNVLGLMAVVALISMAAAGLYHRVWEQFMPLEEAHGPSRWSVGRPGSFSSLYGRQPTILLPNGRIWENGIAHETGWKGGDKNHYVTGSNWLEVIPNLTETVALKADGTLWVSEKPLRWPWVAEGLAQLVRFGEDSDWQSLARDSAWSVVLLKRDGTLWRWGTNYDVSDAKHYQNPGLRSLRPQRLGADSDWTRILSGWGPVYAWKQDGQAWMLHRSVVLERAGQSRAERELAPGTEAERTPSFDNIQFKSLNTGPIDRPFEIGVREDGTLWYRDLSSLMSSGGVLWSGPPMLAQIGHDSNWVAVAGAFNQLAALKTDGSIWKWDFEPQFDPKQSAFRDPPVRLGTNSDWIAVGSVQGRIATLAADGMVWAWPSYDDLHPRWREDGANLWLAPSRRPAKIENLFGAGE